MNHSQRTGLFQDPGVLPVHEGAKALVVNVALVSVNIPGILPRDAVIRAPATQVMGVFD